MGLNAPNVCTGCDLVVSAMNDFQIVPGSVAPLIGVPSEVLMGEFWSVPIQTAVATDGVKPAIQASLFCPCTCDYTVPVLAAVARPPSRVSLSRTGTPSIASVTLRAIWVLNRRSWGFTAS